MRAKSLGTLTGGFSSSTLGGSVTGPGAEAIPPGASPQLVCFGLGSSFDEEEAIGEKQQNEKMSRLQDS